MSLWYDIKKKSYASDAKDNWIKSYVDKMLAELKTKFNTHLEAHYIGDEGRHSAADVVCGDGSSVQAALDNEAAARLQTAATIRQEMNVEDGAIRSEIVKEEAARVTADEELSSRIVAEAAARIASDDNLQTNIDAEIANREAELALKVDKEEGKGLSANDYTDAEKSKLSQIEAGAQKNAVTSVAGRSGAVVLAKSDVGLSNVDNTSDLNKPVSTATQSALDDKADLDYVDNALGGKADASSVLAKTNTTAYTPTGSYHPATKKYVDDSVSAAGGGDMLKSVYDTNGDGVVDDAEKLGGQLPSYYATKAEVDTKPPKSHTSTATTYGAGSTTAYGHVKLANNLTTTTITGMALAANQGKVLDDKITALIAELNTPPALTSVTPDGTKVGADGWTGTGWFCTAANTKYTFNNNYVAPVKGFNRFCLKLANKSEEWKNWTPFFEYNGQSYEFFYSPSRGLYEALLPANSMTASAVVDAIAWKKIPPAILRYGKISGAFGYFESKTIDAGTGEVTNVEHIFFIRRESDFRNNSGMIDNDDSFALFGLMSGSYNLTLEDADINNIAFAVLSADVNATGTFDGYMYVSSIVNGGIKEFTVETIDNFS